MREHSLPTKTKQNPRIFGLWKRGISIYSVNCFAPFSATSSNQGFTGIGADVSSATGAGASLALRPFAVLGTGLVGAGGSVWFPSLSIHFKLSSFLIYFNSKTISCLIWACGMFV